MIRDKALRLLYMKPTGTYHVACNIWNETLPDDKGLTIDFVEGSCNLEQIKALVFLLEEQEKQKGLDTPPRA